MAAFPKFLVKIRHNPAIAQDSIFRVGRSSAARKGDRHPKADDKLTAGIVIDFGQADGKSAVLSLHLVIAERRQLPQRGNAAKAILAAPAPVCPSTVEPTNSVFYTCGAAKQT